MRPWVLLREALATTWSAKVPSALVCFLVAVMCAATLSTVGRTAAVENQVLQRLDAAGSRLLVVTDNKNNDLLGEAVINQASALSVTERAVGVSLPVDVTNGFIGPGGSRAPAWMVVGNLSDVVTLTAGRWPEPGEALVSANTQTKLSMDHPAGVIEVASTTNPSEHNVVGAFTTRTPFDDYATGALIAAPPGTSADTLHVIASTAEQAGLAQRTVLGLIDPPSLDDVKVQSPATLADMQAEVSADLTTFGSALLLGVLGGGALLVAIVVLSDVLVRRPDLGRRRALGATRATILALVLTRTLLPAVLGAVLGTAAGLIMANQYGAIPPWNFTAGTAILALLAALISAIAPALFAATRDPVRVLRTA